LPFVSAGGSSLISSFAGMGICMNIRMRRYIN
jgi:cell division protein FtsW (lipid II flippase)